MDSGKVIQKLQAENADLREACGAFERAVHVDATMEGPRYKVSTHQMMKALELSARALQGIPAPSADTTPSPGADGKDALSIKLARLLAGRDKFIVNIGKWLDFTDVCAELTAEADEDDVAEYLGEDARTGADLIAAALEVAERLKGDEPDSSDRASKTEQALEQLCAAATAFRERG